MPKKIVIEFPDTQEKFEAVLRFADEPELCEALWKQLDEPARCVCSHGFSTGEVFGCHPRPTKHPIQAGSQTAPVGRHRLLFCDAKPGTISYRGFGLSCVYGKATEPLDVGGSPVAMIEDKDLAHFMRAAKEQVWDKTLNHKLPIVIFTKKED